MKKLGVIADDFTGATDIAGFLAENGVKTILTNGVKMLALPLETQAIIVSLKTRSCSPEQAVEESLQALRWLKDQECTQFYFKYASTFDSTVRGNIGPVTDALMEALETKLTVICPALPINRRTVYKGYLFVEDNLLNESGMRDHPLNPMLDAKLTRLMETQAHGRATEIHLEVVEEGSEAILHRLNIARDTGYSYAVLDTLTEEHLDSIALATKDLPLLTGGSGLGGSIAKLLVQSTKQAISDIQVPSARAVILSGSCSVATNAQVRFYKNIGPTRSFEIDAYLKDSKSYINETAEWIGSQPFHAYAPLVYATQTPEEVAMGRSLYPTEDIGSLIEHFFAELALALLQKGFQTFIIAGGETSGVVTQTLGIEAFVIGQQIDPGVPWVKDVNSEVYLALKSGNFGSIDFFKKAQDTFSSYN